ncbi:phage tail tip fiber protein [Photorhabdus namnaonensis]
MKENGDRKAEIVEVREVQVSDQQSLARYQQQVSSQFENTNSSVLNIKESVSKLNESTAKDINQVKAEVNDNTNKITLAKGLIQENKNAIANTDKALSEYQQQVSSQFKNTDSSVLNIKESVSKLNESTAKDINQVKAEVNDNTNKITLAKGLIQENKNAIASTDKALSEYKTQTSAQFKDQKALIETKATTVFEQKGEGSAIYNIKAGIKYNGKEYDAGVVIGSEVKNGKVTTNIGFNAENFTFMNPVNGKLVPFMTAKNNQLFVREAFIENGSITNAKISNVIQSNNYVAGSSGWKIDKNGNAEFVNIKARGEINAISGTLRNVIIEKDCKINGTLDAANITGDIVKVYIIQPKNRVIIEPAPFDRIVLVPIIQAYGHSKGSLNYAIISLNGKTITGAAATSMGSSIHDGTIPGYSSGSGVLPRNTKGELYYKVNDGSKSSFAVTVMVFKK